MFFLVSAIDSVCLCVCVSSSQTASSYIIRNPQPRRSSQSQPARGRDEEQDDIVSADVEEVSNLSQNLLELFAAFQLGFLSDTTLGHVLPQDFHPEASLLTSLSPLPPRAMGHPCVCVSVRWRWSKGWRGRRITTTTRRSRGRRTPRRRGSTTSTTKTVRETPRRRIESDRSHGRPF